MAQNKDKIIEIKLHKPICLFTTQNMKNKEISKPCNTS